MKRQRVFDWRFFVALTVLIAVCYLAVTGLRSSSEVAASGHRADLLIQRLQTEEHDTVLKDQAASTERQQLLAMQVELLNKYSNLETVQQHLLRWLRNHGIQVPARFDTVLRVDHVKAHTASSAPAPAPSPHSKAHRHRGHKSGQPAPAPSAVVPALPNGKPAPGNSGNAPGHNKH